MINAEITIKIRSDTHKLLRKIAAEQGKRMVFVLKRIVEEEAQKLNIK